jgi:hypothetical protein
MGATKVALFNLDKNGKKEVGDVGFCIYANSRFIGGNNVSLIYYNDNATNVWKWRIWHNDTDAGTEKMYANGTDADSFVHTNAVLLTGRMLSCE